MNELLLLISTKFNLVWFIVDDGNYRWQNIRNKVPAPMMVSSLLVLLYILNVNLGTNIIIY